MNESLQGPLSPLELRVWERLRVDFKNEITCIHRALDVLGKVLNNLTDEIFCSHTDLNVLRKAIDNLMKPQSQLSRADIFRQLLIEPQQLPSAVWLVLCVEALERLIAGRLLLFTGHQSRALSCIRDAYECLQWADVCRCCDEESERWLRGKQVRVPKNFNYTPPLSKDSIDYKLFNVWGTHAYFNSANLSLLPLSPFHPALNEVEGITPLYRTNTLASLGFMLMAIELLFAYITNVRPTLRKTIPEILTIHSLVLLILEKIDATLKDDGNKSLNTTKGVL